MLTTAHSQYLHPDYLQPLPTTLDAKKSPLALLAQTCSAIGKDPAPAKTSSGSEKKESGRDSVNSKSESPHRKSASPEHSKERSTSSVEKRETASPSSSDKAGFRAPAPKDIPPLVPITGSGDRSPAPTTSDAGSSKGEREDGGRSSSGPATSTSSVSSSRLSLSTAMLLDNAHSDLAKSAHSASSALPASLKPEHLGAALPHSLYPGCGIPYLGHPLHGMDPSSAAHLPHPSISTPGALALASQHKYSMAGHLPGAPGLSPYTYARVKTTAGASTLVPICRDPYCTNCQITMQSAQLSSACAAGCTQCNHEKPYNGVASSLGASALSSTVPVVSLPGASGLSATAHLSSLYGHAFGVVPGHPSVPYVCNWMSGSEYCGKRFTTSEELLQHLRTHTSSSDVPLSSGFAGYPGFPGLSPAALAACHSSPYPASISPNSMNSLRQAYPRSLSPSSLLAARYHPYKSPLSVLPPPSALSGLPAGLAPYYSPYALYGQRLGAAVAP